MKYLLHLYEGNGCDYTISCGETIESIEVNNKEELNEAVKDMIESYGRDRIYEATLYTVIEKEEIGIDGLFAQDDAEEEAMRKADEEAEERAQLEALKKKYPAPPEK